MSSTYAACAEHVQRLHSAVRQLEIQSRLLQLPSLAGREWFESLERKLLPQLTDDAFLVVAVVGGTNIGKSVIFNHLAGCRASATSPFASGTKHPVCLVPPGFEQRHDLDSIFRGFDLHEWSIADAALEDHPEHRLFWRTSESTPSNLLILDTPDIDGDVRVNWERADNIRRCADVLVAVLTQQKYNDAAVKQFFRKAAEEDKAVLVVFNQVLLPDDLAYWPIWLRTFCQETGVRPEFVYLAPADRRAAEENRLPFYVGHVSNVPAQHGTRSHAPRGNAGLDALRPVSDSPLEVVTTGDDAERRDARSHAERGNEMMPLVMRNLKDDISSLHFHEIKLRTLRGSLRSVLSPETGVPAFLGEIERRSAEFQKVSDLVLTQKISKDDDWPPVPNLVIVQEVRLWWQQQRQGLTKTVHDGFNAISRGLLGVYLLVRDRVAGKPTPPLDLFREREWQMIYDKVESVYERLCEFAELRNPLLQPRIEEMLSGISRSRLLELLKAEHNRTDFAQLIRELVTVEMEAFRKDSPQVFQFMKWLDHGAAAVRPVTSVCLFFTGFGPAGEMVNQVAANTMFHAAAEFAGGTMAATVGESAISGAASTGAGLFEAHFRRLHIRFTAERTRWLHRMLAEHLYRGIPDELKAATVVPQSEAFQAVRDTIGALQSEF